MKLERKYKIKKDIKLNLTKCQGAFRMKTESLFLIKKVNDNLPGG